MVKYHNKDEKIKGTRMVKTKYMHNKPWYCDVCKNNKNYTLGGKWMHLKSKKHIKNLNKQEKYPK